MISLSRTSKSMRAAFAAALFVASAMVASAPAAAQPFGAWLTLSGPQHGYIRIPHNAALNPTNRFTFEAWVSVTDTHGGSCSSIAGKAYTQAWWVGICGTTLRSYLKGAGSNMDGGVLLPGWTHIAIVFNGTRRLHYVDGELVLNVPETGPLTTSSAEMRIGSDANYPQTPAGAIDEVRLWNVARTQAQIRQNLNRRINTAQPGLVGVWALDGSGNATVGPHNGTQMGSGVGFLTFPAGGTCSNSGKYICFHDRFLVNAEYRTGGPGTNTFADASPEDSTSSSGIFSFPNSDIWQVLVNVIDSCSTSGKFTVAVSTPSTLFERINVFDTVGFENRVYYHYPGAPSAPIVDTSAFATCP